MNKRLERGLRILILLQGGARYDALRLAHEMKVTRRTIFRDIAMLKELGLTIDYDVDKATYCVQVPDHSSLGNRSLDAEELERVVQASLAGEDPESVSSATVIRQIAMNLASNQSKTSAVDSNAIKNLSPAPNEQGAESQQSSIVAAPEIGAGVEMHRFAKKSQLICFLIQAIDSQQRLAVWDRVEQREYCVQASEIRYAANGWTLIATSRVGVVLSLSLNRLDFVCKRELAE